MKVSSIEEYGLRCLLTLAKSGEDSMSIDAIGQREGLTRAYVAKIVMMLRNAGLVESSRGRFGGVSLSRPAEEITVAQALQAVDGPLYRATACEDFATGDLCELTHCSIKGLWGRIASSVNEVLENTTLLDLIRCEGHAGAMASPCCSELPPTQRTGDPPGTAPSSS